MLIFQEMFPVLRCHRIIRPQMTLFRTQKIKVVKLLNFIEYRKKQRKNAGIFFGQSSRVVPELHLTAPFSNSKVQNAQKSMFLVTSGTSAVIGTNYHLCRSGSEFFFKNAPISSPGVSNESSVKSRWRIPNPRHLKDHLRAEIIAQNSNF